MGETTSATAGAYDQTTAGIVLMTLLGGIGWFFKTLFDKIPLILDRLDKMEEKKAESLENLATRLEKANLDLAARMEKSLDLLGSQLKICLCDLKDLNKENSNVCKTNSEKLIQISDRLCRDNNQEAVKK